MNSYVVLLRGINVGGKNKIAMAELRKHLENHGYESVTTYIQSGNVVLRSKLGAKAIGKDIEALLTKQFKLDSASIKVLALTRQQLQAVIAKKPKSFGDQPDKYYCDAIFLMGITMAAAMAVFDPRDGVDKIWQGKDVIYSQRLGAQRTKSRLSKIVGTEPYQSMTIRNWNTVTKLLALLEAAATEPQDD